MANEFWTSHFANIQKNRFFGTTNDIIVYICNDRQEKDETIHFKPYASAPSYSEQYDAVCLWVIMDDIL